MKYTPWSSGFYFFPRMQGCLNIQRSINVIYHINRLQSINHIDIEKNLIKSTPFHYKSTEQKVRGEFHNLTKGIYKKPKANIIIYGRRLDPNPPESGISQECLHLPLPFSTVLVILTGQLVKEKEIKGIQNRKEEVKFSPFINDMILYINISGNSIKNIRTNKWV